MRQALKILVLKRAAGRLLYGIFREIRAVWLILVIKSGKMTVERMDTIIAEGRLTTQESAKALGRIRSRRYTSLQNVLFEKVFRKYR
jgi:hypothetical protein